ncbi:MAG: AbrB/MazE/SpoVT family DNA-binding domain-containing protein [Candidatus Aenigmarchaeota archaeon]|nr:AbrB/MazE/SpoVT family DNA-binding domain-containing protein [Candidatus Aenigmarchaeota archaeon]
MTNNAVSRIGPKGQVVLKKMLRDKIGLREGMLVEERLAQGGILIKPVEARKMMDGIGEIAKRLSEKWPKGLTPAEAVRRERK